LTKGGKIIIYTDGSSLGNPGPGGFGAVLMYGGHRREISEGYELTTNNRMELLAVIRALEKIRETGIPIEVYTDSQYVCNAIEKGWLFNWRKKGWKKVKNTDLWMHFYPFYERFKPRFIWVKGHAGNVENERCDVLATTAAAAPDKKVDHGYLKAMEAEKKGLF
jgi:ribonuclease HI